MVPLYSGNGMIFYASGVRRLTSSKGFLICYLTITRRAQALDEEVYTREEQLEDIRLVHGSM